MARKGMVKRVLSTSASGGVRASSGAIVAAWMPKPLPGGSRAWRSRGPMRGHRRRGRFRGARVKDRYVVFGRRRWRVSLARVRSSDPGDTVKPGQVVARIAPVQAGAPRYAGAGRRRRNARVGRRRWPSQEGKERKQSQGAEFSRRAWQTNFEAGRRSRLDRSKQTVRQGAPEFASGAGGRAGRSMIGAGAAGHGIRKNSAAARRPIFESGDWRGQRLVRLPGLRAETGTQLDVPSPVGGRVLEGDCTNPKAWCSRAHSSSKWAIQRRWEVAVDVLTSDAARIPPRRAQGDARPAGAVSRWKGRRAGRVEPVGVSRGCRRWVCRGAGG